MKVGFIERSRYIWVFTNLEEVLYAYSETREGETPKAVLEGFKGVLVSDFYTAYDSIDCPQQKCPVHFIRDMNNDLLANPFDEEFKALARGFTDVIVPIIQTVDRFGLKRYHLARHKPKVREMLHRVDDSSYASEPAIDYQRRLRKYGERMFTFLDYDGVPWNNNNAEHAVKRFALLRNVVGGSSTPEGIKQYLVLLSICETLKRKGVSFLDFLVSGETKLAAFVVRQ